VYVLDGTTDGIVSQLQVEGNADSVAVNTQTNMVYVANTIELVAINGATNQIVARIQETPATQTAPAQPTLVGTSAVAVDETSNTVYVADDAGLNAISVINGSTNVVTDTIQVGNDPVGIAVNPVTHMLYVSNHLDKSVSVIDGTTNTTVATISLSDFPNDLAINASTNVVYVLGDESVISINGATNEVLP
jgi:YVTN family beta-propeller protein